MVLAGGGLGGEGGSQFAGADVAENALEFLAALRLGAELRPLVGEAAGRTWGGLRPASGRSAPGHLARRLSSGESRLRWW